MKPFLNFLAVLCFVSLPAFADTSDAPFNRPKVIKAANKLATEIEHFDEALHDVNAPNHVIKLVHHFEETVMEFATLAQTASYAVLYAEFEHIREDMQMVRQEMNAHSNLLNNQTVYFEYQAMRTAYRQLDHAMYFFDSTRWSKEAVDQLEKDIADLEAKH